MKNLIKIATSASPDTDVQFRRDAYGKRGIRQFLRDVIAMANASVDGPRYIVTGIEIDSTGKKRVRGVRSDDFSGKPSYQALVAEYIEPAVRIRYQPVPVGEKKVGIFEISDCQDRPYMMRSDLSEKLRRGDAYARIKDFPVKLGRRQLQDMFERKFRDSVSAENVEIGFPGDIIHKELRLPTLDLSGMPSAIAVRKLKELIDIQSMSRNTGSTTVMARLTHARLFGSDQPYENRSYEELMEEMSQLERRHAAEDEFFLFEKNPQKLQLVILNQGGDPIEDASLTLVLPNHGEIFVADKLPPILRKGQFIERTPNEQTSYPMVSLKDDSIQVSVKLGDIVAGPPLMVFDSPLRLCIGSSLKGRRLGIRYALNGKNLRRPAKGQLKLVF